MVSSFKNFRWYWPPHFGGSVRAGLWSSLAGYERVWWVLQTIPYTCMFCAFVDTTITNGYIDEDPTKDITEDPFVYVFFIVMFGGLIMHKAVIFSVLYCYRDMPFQLIGAKTVLLVETIPVITAAALRHLLGFRFAYILVLLGCSAYFYVISHFLHIAYEIGIKDVVLGLSMPIPVYMLNVEFSVRTLVAGSCLAVSFYRYITYCAPQVPAHSKKELERLPC